MSRSDDDQLLDLVRMGHANFDVGCEEASRREVGLEVKKRKEDK